MIRTIPSITVQVKQTDSGTLQPSNPIVIGSVFPVTTAGNTYIFQNGSGRFDTLEDVAEGPYPQTGEVPVYDEINDKYEVKRLDFDDLSGDINDVDGGTF